VQSIKRLHERGAAMRPLLLGMNNSLSDDPEFDLFPYPEGSAGWRLWKLLPEGTPRRAYLESFERLNLLRAREWDMRAARAAASTVRPMLAGRRVVLLGTEVRAALGFPITPPMIWHNCDDFDWAALPHPSGRNLWYNSSANRAAASAFLRDLMGAAA